MTRLPDGSPLPLLGLRAGDVPERVVVVGDPARAERVAGRLDRAREVGRNREYVTFVGGHRGAPVGVVSHGVGAAGAAVCFEELCRGGATRLVRAGTCGGLSPDVVDGHLVVATAAARDEGLTERLVPSGWPAVADVDLTVALRASVPAGVTAHAGVVVTSDLFYPHEVLGDDLSRWARAGALAVEMECAALFVVAALHGARAGAVLAVDGNPLLAADTAMAGYDPHRDVVRAATDAAAAAALDAVTADAP